MFANFFNGNFRKWLKRYQYEDDREVPTATIRSLVSVAVERDLAADDAHSEGEK